MSTTCTTRGMSFDPQQAKIDRLRLKARQQAEAKQAEQQRIEQVRSCYREHSPAQIKQAGAMIHTCAKSSKHLGIDVNPKPKKPGLEIVPVEDFLNTLHTFVEVPALTKRERSIERLMTSNRAAGL